MTKPFTKQSTHKTKTTNTWRASLLRHCAEGEPTTSSLSFMASASNRSIESVRGVPGAHPWPFMLQRGGNRPPIGGW